jgi:hypothetical protein
MNRSMARRTRPWLIALGVVVLVGLVLWRGAAIWNPYAYPGTTLFRSLGGTAGKFNIKLPDCSVEDLHYSYDNGIDDMGYLTFTADKACVGRFIERNELRGGRRGPANRIPMARDAEVQGFGWPLTADRTVAHYVGHPKPDADLQVAVDGTGDRQTVYARAFEF